MRVADEFGEHSIRRLFIERDGSVEFLEGGDGLTIQFNCFQVEVEL